MCYQYWPGKRAQSYGEFRVELLSEENRGGFLLRAFSVQQAKVSMVMLYMCLKIHSVKVSGDTNNCLLFNTFQTVVQHSASSVPEWVSDYQCADVNAIITLIEQVSKVQRRTGNHPIVVHGL